MGHSVLFPLNWSRAHRNVNTSALEVSFQPWDFMESLFEILSIVFPGKCLSFPSPSLSAFPQASPVWSRGELWILLDGIMEIFLLVWKQFSKEFSRPFLQHDFHSPPRRGPMSPPGFTFWLPQIASASIGMGILTFLGPGPPSVLQTDLWLPCL